jgi:hypothetical protein
MPLLMRISAMSNNRTKLEELGASSGAFSANSEPFFTVFTDAVNHEGTRLVVLKGDIGVGCTRV